MKLYHGGLGFKTYRLVDQFLFHTPKALEFLKFAGSEAVDVRE